MTALGFALAALIGLSLGLLGGGGSTLTVPILVYVLGMEPKPAIAMSLAVVGGTSLVGAVSHWRAGNVVWRVALVFGGVAMVGTLLGTRLATLVSGETQLIVFAAVMLAAAGFMFRPAPDHPARVSGWAAQSFVAAQGFVVGILTGLVGVGGGFLIVPALVLLAGLPMKQAVGTSLLIIAANTLAGFIGYLDQVTIDTVFLGGFTAIAILGVLAGARLARYVPAAALRRAFAVFLIIMGAAILLENIL